MNIQQSTCIAVEIASVWVLKQPKVLGVILCYEN